MSGGQLDIAGDSSAFVVGGTNTVFGSTVAAAAIQSDGGTVELDPDIRLNAVGTGTSLRGTSTFRMVARPTMTVAGVVPGSALLLTIHAAAGNLFGMVVSPPVMPLPSVFGELWIDFTASFAIASGVVPAGNIATATIPVPPGFWTAGTVFTFQGVEVDSTPHLTLSTPIDVMLAAQ